MSINRHGTISDMRPTMGQWGGQTKELKVLAAKIPPTFPSLSYIASFNSGVSPSCKTRPGPLPDREGWSEQKSLTLQPCTVLGSQQPCTRVLRMPIEMLIPTFISFKPLLAPRAASTRGGMSVSHSPSIKGINIFCDIEPGSLDAGDHVRLSLIKLLGNDSLGQPSTNSKVDNRLHASIETL